GVPVARARPSLSQRPGLRAAETVAPGQHCHGGLCHRASVSTSRRGPLCIGSAHAVRCPPGMTLLLLHTTRDGGSQRMRVPRVQFRSLSLEVHGILSDVPLHDVTVVDLPGGGAGRTISDVRALLARENVRAANPIVRGLFALRVLLGRLFGWDSDMHMHQETSSLHRLSSDITRRFVATMNNEIVGLVSFSLHAEKRIGEIGLNAVLPDHAGQGVGTSMYEFAMARMKESGMALATVSTGGDPSHLPARRAYQKAGFGPALPSVFLYKVL